MSAKPNPHHGHPSNQEGACPEPGWMLWTHTDAQCPSRLASPLRKENLEATGKKSERIGFSKRSIEVSHAGMKDCTQHRKQEDVSVVGVQGKVVGRERSTPFAIATNQLNILCLLAGSGPSSH